MVYTKNAHRKGTKRMIDGRFGASLDRRSLEQRLVAIESLCWSEVKKLVKEVDNETYCDYQYDVIRVMLCRLLNDPKKPKKNDLQPRPEQVRAVRRLVFRHGDTLLIARTGFGKSIIMHAVPLLTGKISIQLTPLNKLGEEQVRDIQRLPDAKPCLVTGETKHKDSQLFEKIRELKYTHIVMGPEQLLSPEFRDVATDARFMDALGLVAIDEAHLIPQWRTFREEYGHIFQFRASMPEKIPFFGCSATVCEAHEHIIKKYGGFQQEAEDEPRKLAVIRTSVDRPEITLLVLPLLRKTLMSYNVLYWLLEDMTHPNPTDDGELEIARRTNPQVQPAPDPKRIKKTVVFLDGITIIRNAVGKLRQWMMRKGCTAEIALQTVEMFASTTAEADKDRILTEFRSEHSRIRVLVATSAFGIGMNIPDIERVVQYGMNIDRDLGDIFQRVGRAARGRGRTAIAIIFLPYWYFDYQGQERCAIATGEVSSAHGTAGRRRRATRNMMRREREASQPQEVKTVTDISPSSSEDDSSATETQDIDDMFSWDNEECVLALSDCQALVNKTKWSGDDLEKRTKIAPEWRGFCNARCRRKVLLRFLQEHRSQEEIIGTDRAVPEGRCCNGWGCTPGKLHGIVTTVPPIIHDVGAKPSRGTMAWFALQYLEKWCSEAARNLEDYRGMVGQPPASFVLRPQQQWLIAQQFFKVEEKDDWKLKTVLDFRKLITPGQWRHSAQLEVQLVQMLDDSVEKIINAYQEEKKSKASRRDSSISERSQYIDDTSALGRASPLTGSQRLGKDNTVARRTIQDEVEELRDRRRARTVRIGATEVIPIVNDVPEKGSSSMKRLTGVQGSGDGGRGREANWVDVQSLESDVEPPEPPETPVLQLRRFSAVVEGAEGRGARHIKYTSRFQSIIDKRGM
jgi:superfamily II DNA helicase RecQ